MAVVLPALLLLVTGRGEFLPGAVHPRLLITPGEVSAIRAGLGKAPLFDAALAEARDRIEAVLQETIDVPVPADAAGYTHERHKKNYTDMQLAGQLYQITGDRRYADFVRVLLEKYAELYPTLSGHPAGRGSSPSRLFWQSLNENVWLVHVTQAYDCIYDTLSAADRTRIEDHLLRPMARLIIDERPRELDQIHNHGTWAATAVAMVGYVMGDEEMVKKALQGSQMNGKGGYFAQLAGLFSPDGYYVEGPYYARYVLMPFYVLAQVIENNQPELQVYARRDGVLGKALFALLQQTYVNGEFFPINDALKEKTYRSPEVLLALDLAYVRYGREQQLLSIARQQGGVVLSPSGFEVAHDLELNPNPPAFSYRSLELRDGPEGDTGGIGILRQQSGESESLALMKYTTFGMGHGHFDKLQLLFYDQGREIISDYGAARFLNVEQKYGGRYLPENISFARQTIAHNTVVVDGSSQYSGSNRQVDNLHSERHFFDARDRDFQIMSARDDTAYPGVAMQRTVAMVRDPRLSYPVLIDVYQLVADKEHDYDMPFYYQGHFLGTNVSLNQNATERRPLGKSNGYEHLWLEAEGQAEGAIKFTWMNGNRYYSICSAADAKTGLSLVRIGANDPNFNLRNEPAVILHHRAKSHVFATVIEPHGIWDGTLEFTHGGFPTIQEVKVTASTSEGTAVRVKGDGGIDWILLLANGPASDEAMHRINSEGEDFTWQGNAVLRRK